MMARAFKSLFRKGVYMKKIKKSTITDLILGIVLTLLTLFAFLISWGPLETLEFGVYDLNSSLRVKPSQAPVAVIAIDEQSIANLVAGPGHAPMLPPWLIFCNHTMPK